MRVVVIAVGNPVRQDGAVAWRVAEALGEEEPGLQVVTAHGLLPDLVAHLEGTRGAVFVEARDAGDTGAPGTVTVERLVPSAVPGDLSQPMTPAALLALAEQLHGGAPRAALVTIAGTRFDFGEELSEPVTEAIPTAVRCILRLADDWSAEGA